ncbi:ester cyclase [Natronococcus wangiae]|uniref:ester cyclase n=1 Tax=Natronococcus wangiae TaxID=3068275 RepID=UPI00273DCF90|nr:ester cyclase [Natronococcus sp. AD5]
MATTEAGQNEELARRDIEEVWNEGNYDLIDDLYAEDFVHHDPAYPGEIRGPDGQKEYVRMYRTTLGGPNVTIDELISDGDIVSLRWSGHGRHEKELMGVEPTHEELELAGMTMARIEDGNVAEMWSHYDALGLLRQIGAVESPTE